MDMRNKLVPSGIFWFLFFVMILALSSVYANQETIMSALDCDSMRSCVTSMVEDPAQSRDTLMDYTITRREVVEEESSVISVIDTASPAVVSIIIKTVEFDFYSGPVSIEDGIGTGFIVSPDGVIITNSHVVEDLDAEYSIVLRDGRTFDVQKISLDQPTDLAIIEVEATDLPTVPLGDSSVLNVGQTAIAIGNALGRFQNTVTVGVVSGIARDLTAASGYGGGLKTYTSVIQTDAALNPGNSGGPLLNSAGQVIGINVATTRGADNIGFAIPVDTLKPLLETYLVEGRIVRPYIGIAYNIISPDLARVRGLPVGAFVSRVLPDSPADVGGLQPRDIILSINDQDIGVDNTISSFVNNAKVGDTFEVEVDREGDLIDLTIVLEEAPENF
jgi:S1-C subfamily serine protease